MIKCIETICRKFSWSAGTETSRKALISWEKLCWPIVAGGLNFLDIGAWNKAATCKLLWSLSKKKDKIWIQWVHMYYGNRGSIWGNLPRQASWMMQKLLKAHKYFEEAGWNED